MDRTQITGIAIIIGGVLQLLVFAIAFARRSYLAVAVPVGLVLAGVSALAVWVGWTMLTTETDLPEPEEQTESAPPA
ncbi:MAG TPA: hypothetical protein VFA70_11855 [Dehalococcoidia bacterium]|jgi:hypothetical protein|nr:hypothetical protein [Dehalococcoidia bacterium]